MSTKKDPVHELEMARALLQEAKLRQERLDHRAPTELATLIRGLRREIAWWESRALKAVKGR